MTTLNNNKLNVGIIDYGLGNLYSIQRAVAKVGGLGIISSDPEILKSCDRLILPGVGAFSVGMKGLKERNLIEFLYLVADKKVPILGICLGMQLLMSNSHEFGLHQGLNFIKGRVLGFKPADSKEDSFKIPHVGWNNLLYPEKNLSRQNFNSANGDDIWRANILSGLKDRGSVYFIHSYFVVPDNEECVVAETIYGKDKFCSVFAMGNIMGCQFHPERSGEIGLQIYRNFLFN